MALFRLLLRHRAQAVLVSALLAGCSQSLFDGSPGGNGNGHGDAAPGEPDARVPLPDGSVMPPMDGGDPIELDGGGGQPDAAPPRAVCPEPCAGDAFGDFKNVQGGLNGEWHYVEVQPEKPDSPYVDMVTTILPGPALGWIGSGAVEPSIGFCNSPTDGGPCQEMAKVLALASPGNAADAHYPGLMWIVPEDGRYALSGTWRVSSAAPAAPTTMKFTRNSHSEVLHEDGPMLTTAPYEFNYEIDVVKDDRVVLTATATTSEGVTVGVDLFITGPLRAQ
jgi:hypothetical protein